MIVKLQRNPDHLGARLGGECGRDGAVDAARHGNDDPGLPVGAAELEVHLHLKRAFPSLYPNFTPHR